jgi:bacteriocin biosynthesis cyclodehydratase domain-containing protein
MANSLRLNHPPISRIMIGGIGEFGRRVAGFMSAWLSESQEFDPDSGIGTAFSVQTDAVVLALWRPEPELCELADQLSFRHQVPWLPVIIEHPVIRIGPFVLPRTGPCFGCYARRRAQHDRQPWITAALDAGYRHDRDCGPRGYLPHQARMAAALALETLHEGMASAPARSQSPLEGPLVTTIGLVGGGLQVNPVIAGHNCGRCGSSGSSAKPDQLSELAARYGGGLAAPLFDPRMTAPAEM